MPSKLGTPTRRETIEEIVNHLDSLSDNQALRMFRNMALADLIHLELAIKERLKETYKREAQELVERAD